MKNVCHFTVTLDHVCRSRKGEGNPLALALRENGLMEHPQVEGVSTRGDYGNRSYAYRHAPTVMRWLNRWRMGEEMEPLRLTLNRESRQLNTARPAPGG